MNSFDKLINSFTKIPTVGMKTAQRYAYSIINLNDEDVENFAKNLLDVKKNIHYCKICGNWTTSEICDICESRTSNIICVVKEPKDIVNFEKVRDFKPLYHVLHGTISPLKAVGPDDINIKSLLTRLSEGKFDEVIIALNTDVESEATSIYLTNLLKTLNIKVSRLAQGISMGSELEYVDSATLSRAVIDRKTL